MDAAGAIDEARRLADGEVVWFWRLSGRCPVCLTRMRRAEVGDKQA